MTRLGECLAKALDDLAASLETGTDPRRLSIPLELLERRETAPPQGQSLAALTVEDPKKNSETVAWLFYHLRNVHDLMVAAREAVSRLVRSEVRTTRTLS